PFVMDFLGNVNVFQGRVANGQAHLGEFAVEFPDYPLDVSLPATLYARPHELDIERPGARASGIATTVRRINPTGSLTRISLLSHGDDREIQVELTADRFAELNLRLGDHVFLQPKRVRAFLPEYEI